METLKKQGFTLAVVLAVLGAFALPGPGASGGVLGADWMRQGGIMVIFLLQGVSLPTRELAKGLGNVRLHVFVQGWIFAGVPVLVLLAGMLLRGQFEAAVWNGFLYLAVLPTTVSSAVVLSAAGGGDTSGALFNVTLANILGVFVVPAWCLVLFSVSGEVPLDPVPMLVKLSWLILLPLAVGQLLRPMLAGREWFGRVRPHFKTVNNGIIIYTIYAAFCNSVSGETWGGFAFGTLASVVLMTVVILGVVSWLVWVSSGWLGLERPARVSAFFCGSQKTLAAGVPMATALFGNGAGGPAIDLGLLILPLMIYHPLQLLLGGWLVPRLND